MNPLADKKVFKRVVDEATGRVKLQAEPVTVLPYNKELDRSVVMSKHIRQLLLDKELSKYFRL
jgi:hypothetical protein